MKWLYCYDSDILFTVMHSDHVCIEFPRQIWHLLSNNFIHT